MVSTSPTPKIQTEHLARQALVYIRQSTLMQVRQHTASTARQYDLAQYALELGWSEEQVILIDQDQGHSAASISTRAGFQFLVTEVSLGHAGAVLSLEASRLARSSSDWHRLLEICALTNTLVIDEEGVYDPRQYNDRLLLGFKGALSEAELHWLHTRLMGGKLTKARQGELRFRPPIGYIYNAANDLVFDPDEQIQDAVRLVFELFETLRSGFGVVKHFSHHRLLFPTRLWSGEQKGEVVWRPLRHGRVIEMLHNPCYAGAYVYGRSKVQPYWENSQATRVKRHKVKPENWPIILHQAHPAYITWEQFLANRQHLNDNRSHPSSGGLGAVREGAALLQGVVLCGRCGRRMTTRYQEDGVRPAYHCDYAYKTYGGQRCQSIRGHKIDAAVAQALLAAVEPAQLAISMAALEQLEAQAHRIDRQWQLRLERANYEAELAKRRFMRVDPDNRLVARTLEREWNDKLTAVQHLEREYATVSHAQARLVTPEERARILALAQDLPLIWQAATTTQAERKRLLRCLIKDVTLSGHQTTIQVGIQWQTGTVTELTLPRSTQRTTPEIVDRIRELTTEPYTDEAIATALNQAGWTTARGLPFTANRVEDLRRIYHIPTGCSWHPRDYPSGQRPDGRYSIQAAAKLLNQTDATIYRWCRSGRLDAIQRKPGGPFWIKLTPELMAQLGRTT